MKIIYKQSLVEYVEALNKRHPVRSVEVSHCDIREVQRVFRDRHPLHDNYRDENNHMDVGYPGASGDVCMDGIYYQATDNTEDFR